MAAVVGIVSAGVGIASFVAQVVVSINALKDAYRYNQRNAPENIMEIIGRLKFLKSVLEKVQPSEGNPIVDHAIQSCQSTFTKLERALDSLLKKMDKKPFKKKPAWKSAKLQISRQIRAQIEEIRAELDSMAIMLILSSSACLNPPVSPENGVQKAIDSAESHSIPSTLDNSADVKNVHRANTHVLLSNSALSYPEIPSTVQRTSPCSMKHCHCSCHLTNGILGRYWGIKYTPMSMIFGKCDNKRCDMRNIRWSFRVAFNRFSIPWAFLIDLEFILGTATYSLRPALSLQRVVNYTSPGFAIIWKCRKHLISLSEAQDQLRELDRSPSRLRQHVNPDGNNYIQELLYSGPWSNQDNQFALIYLLLNELGMTLENEDNKFLTRCASWIGEGRHLELLYFILNSGFDPSRIHSPLWQDWPTPCSPNWISEEFTPDPFFLEYLTAIAKEDPGFGGSTYLQDAVLCGSEATVATLLPKMKILEDHRNFLGQTPLHLAVRDLHICTMIVNAGHELNVTDRWGITPLMYAAAMGIGDVVQLLISKGAKITTRATKYDRDFMHYASVRGHWDLVLDSLRTIRSYYPEKFFQCYVRKALCHLVSNDTWIGDSRVEYFKNLTELCDDVNFTFGDENQGREENNLLHYVETEEELQVLIRHGFHGFNRPNSKGELPIQSIVRKRFDVDLFRCCLDNETDVNHIDHNGRTTIFELLRGLKDLSSITWDIVDSIKICLERGIDISHGDSCRCACSINGCNISSAFDLNFTNLGPGFIWALEWLSLIEEWNGYEESKTMILSLIRRTRFDLLGITHVCCHGGDGLAEWRLFYFNLRQKNVQEVPDKDQESIDLLEEEMDKYSSEALETLRYEWMVLLKQTYDKNAAKDRDKNNRETSNLIPGCFVDFKNDTYSHNIVALPWHCDPVYEMSRYAFWLQHEYLRTINAESTSFKAGWYERRSRLFSELLRIFGISKQKMKQAIEATQLEETRSGKIDIKAIINQFLTSQKAN